MLQGSTELEERNTENSGSIQTIRHCSFGVCFLRCTGKAFYVSLHPSHTCKQPVVPPCFPTKNSGPGEQLGSGQNASLPAASDEANHLLNSSKQALGSEMFCFSCSFFQTV